MVEQSIIQSLNMCLVRKLLVHIMIKFHSSTCIWLIQHHMGDQQDDSSGIWPDTKLSYTLTYCYCFHSKINFSLLISSQPKIYQRKRHFESRWIGIDTEERLLMLLPALMLYRNFESISGNRTARLSEERCWAVCNYFNQLESFVEMWETKSNRLTTD